MFGKYSQSIYLFKIKQFFSGNSKMLKRFDDFTIMKIN